MAVSYIKYLAKVLHFLITRHRALGMRDWLAASVCVVILFCIPPITCVYFIGWGDLQKHWQLSVSLFISHALIVSVPLMYIFRLRALGITDADFQIKSGINYRQALGSASHGFDFQGVGAAKLSKEDDAFRAALNSAHKAGRDVRFLLLDPKSPGAIDSMERSDGASGYLESVEGSIKFIKKVSSSFENVAKVSLYSAHVVNEVEPFRLFITDEACLISPFVPANGVNDQGSGLPQVRISKYGFPKRASPTLYKSFKDSFEKSWYSANGENGGNNGGV